jgi:O-antigen ligase
MPMSIRIALCFLFVIWFSYYAWRNWFVSLCGAICLMAVLEHPDMPKSIGGFQGLNPWNFLMLNVLLAWFTHRQQEGLVWDLPRHIATLLVFYLLVVFAAFARLMLDHGAFPDFSHLSAISEYIINCVKWVLPGLLLYDGCRTRKRVTIGLVVLLSLYFLLAIQVTRWVPLSAATESGGEMSRLANKLLLNEVGYHRVNLSMLLSGASWAILTTMVLVRKPRDQLLLAGAAMLVALGQALTGGRAGYVTWGLVGLILGLARWRKLLPLIPLAALGVGILLPSVRNRMLQGFGSSSGIVVVETSDYEITSGRTLAWSYVIPKIKESPVFGYGREAMVRTGLYRRILSDHGEGETFPHPHNAYLEMLLDNGLVGFMLVIPFYLVILRHSFGVLLDRSDPLYAAVGGTACALVLALLIAAMGSQTFYPREGSVGMWAAIGLMLRVSVERQRALETGEALFGAEEQGA